jgi:hypothetical protein
MLERRQDFRRRVYYGGRLAFNDRKSTLDCIVRNFSQVGAKIETNGGAILPDELDITIERRVVFTCGLGIGLVLVCLTATTVGYMLAANLPEALAAAILLLTPLAFLLSTARNAKHLVDVLALLLGLALYPLVSLLNTGVDILISGLSAGTIAFGVHWWWRRT